MVWTAAEISKATGLTQRHVTRLFNTKIIKGEKKAAGWLAEDEEAERFVREYKAKTEKTDSES